MGLGSIFTCPIDEMRAGTLHLSRWLPDFALQLVALKSPRFDCATFFASLYVHRICIFSQFGANLFTILCKQWRRILCTV